MNFRYRGSGVRAKPPPQKCRWVGVPKRVVYSMPEWYIACPDGTLRDPGVQLVHSTTSIFLIALEQLKNVTCLLVCVLARCCLLYCWSHKVQTRVSNKTQASNIDLIMMDLL